MAKVLSTTQRAPRSWAKADTSATSTIASIGFDGVSSHTIFVSGRHTRSRAAGSVRSAVS